SFFSPHASLPPNPCVQAKIGDSGVAGGGIAQNPLLADWGATRPTNAEGKEEHMAKGKRPPVLKQERGRRGGMSAPHEPTIRDAGHGSGRGVLAPARSAQSRMPMRRHRAGHT